MTASTLQTTPESTKHTSQVIPSLVLVPLWQLLPLRPLPLDPRRSRFRPRSPSSPAATVAGGEREGVGCSIGCRFRCHDRPPWSPSHTLDSGLPLPFSLESVSLPWPSMPDPADCWRRSPSVGDTWCAASWTRCAWMLPVIFPTSAALALILCAGYRSWPALFLLIFLPKLGMIELVLYFFTQSDDALYCLFTQFVCALLA